MTIHSQTETTTRITKKFRTIGDDKKNVFENIFMHKFSDFFAKKARDHLSDHLLETLKL